MEFIIAPSAQVDLLVSEFIGHLGTRLETRCRQSKCAFRLIQETSYVNVYYRNLQRLTLQKTPFVQEV
jgi:hypothetical protein